MCQALPELRVPEESGVCFFVTPTQESLCAIYQIDDNALIPAHDIRPDYLVMWLSGGRVILTIVELKGIVQKALSHGLDQILSLKARLERDVFPLLPGRLRNRIHVQGLLVGAPNAQFPNAEIAQEAKRGFIIAPRRYRSTLEIGDFVSRPLTAEDLGSARSPINWSQKSRRPHYTERLLRSKFDLASLQMALRVSGTNQLHFQNARTTRCVISVSGVSITFKFGSKRMWGRFRNDLVRYGGVRGRGLCACCTVTQL